MNNSRGTPGSGGRWLHQSTVALGDQTHSKPTYTTTHTESFSGKSCDGQPRDPCCPTQHHSSADVSSSIPAKSTYTSTHSRDVHSPKDVTQAGVLRSLRTRNWTRNSEGRAMKEIIHPPEATAYISSYHTEHCSPASKPRASASGQPTHWHRHNILTGEDKGPARPKNPRRPSGERILWAARRWETDCCSLRLY